MVEGTVRSSDKNHLGRRGVWVIWGKTWLESEGPRRSVSGCDGILCGPTQSQESDRNGNLQGSGNSAVGGFLQELSPQEGSCFPLSTGWRGKLRGSIPPNMGRTSGWVSSKVGGSSLSNAKEAGEKQPGLTNKSTQKLPWGIPQVPEEAWKGFIIGWNWEKRGKMLKKQKALKRKGTKGYLGNLLLLLLLPNMIFF